MKIKSTRKQKIKNFKKLTAQNISTKMSKPNIK